MIWTEERIDSRNRKNGKPRSIFIKFTRYVFLNKIYSYMKKVKREKVLITT